MGQLEQAKVPKVPAAHNTAAEHELERALANVPVEQTAQAVAPRTAYVLAAQLEHAVAPVAGA